MDQKVALQIHHSQDNAWRIEGTGLSRVFDIRGGYWPKKGNERIHGIPLWEYIHFMGEDKMTKILLEKIKHGITVYDAIGAYTKQHKNVLEIYASHYELNDYISIAQYVDPAAFITICPVRTIKGNYLKKTIV